MIVSVSSQRFTGKSGAALGVEAFLALNRAESSWK